MSSPAAAPATTTALSVLTTALRRTLPNAQVMPTVLPDCAGITLGLINADFHTGPLPPEVMRAVIAEPAYWAFCWGSGLALARYLLQKPALVRGRTVLDLGSGSGVAGIAAARAGAARVLACDTDADARRASAVNAELNGVDVQVIARLEDAPRVDCVLLADVLYDASNLPLLDAAQRHAADVWVADSRIRQLERPDYQLSAELDALTLPNLGEFDEFGRTRIWHAAADGVH